MLLLKPKRFLIKSNVLDLTIKNEPAPVRSKKIARSF